MSESCISEGWGGGSVQKVCVHMPKDLSWMPSPCLPAICVVRICIPVLGWSWPANQAQMLSSGLSERLCSKRGGEWEKKEPNANLGSPPVHLRVHIPTLHHTCTSILYHTYAGGDKNYVLDVSIVLFSVGDWISRMWLGWKGTISLLRMGNEDTGTQPMTFTFHVCKIFTAFKFNFSSVRDYSLMKLSEHV